MVAAIAVGVGAVASAAGSAVAAGEAADATRDASRAAISEQEKAREEQAKLSAPYRQLGESALPQLQTLLGIAPAGQSPAQTTQAQLDALRNTPGYQFQQQQGTQSTINAATAMGLGLSGNTLEGLSKFNQGLADTTYQQTVGNLQNAVSTGQAAAAGQAAHVGEAANNISNIDVNQGNTLAGIRANEVAGITKAVGGAANQYMEMQTLQGLENPSEIPLG
jgi:hypothetical protein